MNNQLGALIVITGPSGVGKGSLRSQLASELPWLKESISATTREKRIGEVDGVDYFFVSREQFQQMIEQGELIEWAEFAGNCYGTPRPFLQDILSQGYSLLLEIEVQGALNIKKIFPEAHLVFIDPPSLAVLEQRLRNRSTNSEEDIQRRLATAIEELKQKPLFDTVIVNDDLEQCKQTLLRQIHAIVDHGVPFSR